MVFVPAGSGAAEAEFGKDQFASAALSPTSNNASFQQSLNFILPPSLISAQPLAPKMGLQTPASPPLGFGRPRRPRRLARRADIVFHRLSLLSCVTFHCTPTARATSKASRSFAPLLHRISAAIEPCGWCSYSAADKEPDQPGKCFEMSPTLPRIPTEHLHYSQRAQG